MYNIHDTDWVSVLIAYTHTHNYCIYIDLELVFNLILFMQLSICHNYHIIYSKLQTT